MKLGTEVGLGPGHIVLDADSAPLFQRGTAPPQFSAHFCCGQTAACIKIPLGMELGLGPGAIVLDGDPAPLPKRGRSPPQIFNLCLLRQNGWMDEAGIWYGSWPQSMRLCVRWGPSLLPPKGRGTPSTIIGPFLLWPNGCMHQNATWYRARPRPRRLCVRWGPRSPVPIGAQTPQFSAHICCGQMAAWIKMSLVWS